LVQSYYQKFLGRPATNAEVNLYVIPLQGGTLTDEQAIASILSSQEYFQKPPLVPPTPDTPIPPPPVDTVIPPPGGGSPSPVPGGGSPSPIPSGVATTPTQVGAEATAT